MIVIHVSDTHGRFPDLCADPLRRARAIVHSGDLLPNRAWGDREVDSVFQPLWCRENVRAFDNWRADLPVIFCAGNHDFVIPRWHGLIDCTNKIVRLDGVRFYGFPYMPEYGTWNFGCSPGELAERFSPVAKMVEDMSIDVLVCHCPPLGTLDRTADHYDRGGQHIGNPALAKAMRRWTARPMLPLTILCGHVHESHGLVEEIAGWITVSNAATTSRLMEVA